MQELETYKTGNGVQVLIAKDDKNLKFPLTPIWVLALRSVHARPSARPPINMSGNIPAHMSAESPSSIYIYPIYIDLHLKYHQKCQN